MIADLKADSARWMEEKRNRDTGNRSRGSGQCARNSNLPPLAYRDSLVHQSRQHWGPTEDTYPSAPEFPYRAEPEDRYESYITSSQPQDAFQDTTVQPRPDGSQRNPRTPNFPEGPSGYPGDNPYYPQMQPTTQYTPQQTSYGMFREIT